MVLLPLSEIAVRLLGGGGVSGSAAVLQHLTLAVALFGGAAAAREGRLLSLSTAAALFSGPAREWAHRLTGGFGAGVTLLLAHASWQFVRFEREGGAEAFYGIPSWAVALVLPLGFVLIAGRLVLKASDSPAGRAAALASAVAVLLLAGLVQEPSFASTAGLFAALLTATALGLPIFAALGGAALLLFGHAGVPAAAVPVETYRLVTNPTVPTIPLFTLAGYFLAEGGASRRLVRVFQALFGWARGGPALVTALVCAFFTAFTGASGVTILALGGLLLPVLAAARYAERDSLGLLTACGSLGLLFPPSLPIILYGVVAKTPIDRLFLAGILPGLLLVALTAWWGVSRGPKDPDQRPHFRGGEALAAVREAKWELALPPLVLGGLFSGLMTLVEVAAFAALYAFLVETFVHRDLSLRKDSARVSAECAVLVGGVLLILGVALGLTSYLVDAQVPDRAAEWVRGSIESKVVFLLLLNLFLLVVGCLMDIFSAIVVVVPLLLPMGEAFGIDPVHLGIIFLANMELGYLTPPVGMNLFLSSYRFGKPLTVVYRSVVPMLLVLLAGVLLITYVPQLTLFLPNAVQG